MKPVYDELSFLHSLCELVRQGKFQPNLGIKVQHERCGRKQPAPSQASLTFSQPSRETDEQRRKRLAVGKTQIAEMRKQLGMKAPTENQGIRRES